MSRKQDEVEFDAGDRELEKRLRAAFAAKHPGGSFERSLWVRLQGRRSWSQRIGGFLDGLWGLPGMGTLGPALAVLVVVAGVLVLVSGHHSSQSATTSGAAPYRNGAEVGSGFGSLPAPAGGTVQDLSKIAPQPNTAPVNPGAGAGDLTRPQAQGAPMTAAGLPAFPPEAPVFRYTVSAAGPVLEAIQSGSGLAISLAPNRGQPAYLASVAEAVKSADIFATAEAFLGRHRLLPGYVSIRKRESDQVVYNRLFLLPDGTEVPEVTIEGAAAGTRVTVTGASVTAVAGPLELPLEQALYPLRPLASVLPALPPGLAGSAPRLVYVAVPDGDGLHGYLEPVYLFSGPGQTGIVAAVAGRYLRP